MGKYLGLICNSIRRCCRYEEILIDKERKKAEERKKERQKKKKERREKEKRGE